MWTINAIDRKWVLSPVAVWALLTSGTSGATDGYFANAYGLKAAGMGGVSAAIAEEPFGGATNPAAMSFLDSNWQASGAWFSPRRSASRTGSGPTRLDGSATSDKTNFFIPEIGVNWRIRDNLSIGLSIYGNGLNTDYPSGTLGAQSACARFNSQPGPYNLLCGTGNLGVDAAQVLFSPYAAWQFVPDHSIGIAPIVAWQHFSADGLQALDNPLLSTGVGQVTNRGHDHGWGIGVRVGYMGHITNEVSFGIAYASKVSMGRLGSYAGLLAEGGAFDIPQSVLAGLAFRPTLKLLIALDYQRIFYGNIPALNNSSFLIGNCLQVQRDACLGGSNGTAFGWRDIDVWKVGVQYVLNDAWTVRAGFSRSGNPIPSNDVTLNILAPAVVQNHYAGGLSYHLDATSEITAAAGYAQKNSVTGPSLFTVFGAPPTTADTISMKQYFLGAGYSRTF
jgi:long-chain fatty acid transport protein